MGDAQGGIRGHGWRCLPPNFGECQIDAHTPSLSSAGASDRTTAMQVQALRPIASKYGLKPNPVSLIPKADYFKLTLGDWRGRAKTLNLPECLAVNDTISAMEC